MTEEIQQVEKLEEIENIIKSNKYLIVNFLSLWCPPCKYISSYFLEDSKIYKEVKFIKVDIDRSEEISDKYDIKTMPTFILFKDGEIFSRFNGGNEKKIIKELDKLLEKVTPVPEGHVNCLKDFDKILSENELVVLDFYATWCSPCIEISPYYEELKSQYTTMKFLKCDIDDGEDIFKKYEIKIMPSFISFRKGKEDGRYSGVEKKEIDELVKDLFTPENPPVTLNVHEHPLFDKKRQDFMCKLCYNKYEPKQKCFLCKECKYIICQKCKDCVENNKPIERNKDVVFSQFHKAHPLFWRSNNNCYCDICRNSFDESYRCQKCDFDLCTNCLKKEGEALFSNLHKHPLAKENNEDNEIKCNFCKESKNKYYVCKNCKFYLCEECKEKNIQKEN